VGKLKLVGHLKELVIDGTIVFKLIITKRDGRYIAWIVVAEDRHDLECFFSTLMNIFFQNLWGNSVPIEENLAS
jgi:hypothetical protein